MARDIDQLGDLQAAVMEIVWERGEATVRDVRERLPEPGPAYTTVLTVMQKLAKAGWLTHRAEGRTYVYRATRSRSEAGQSVLRRVVGRVFDGDRLLAFQHLIDDEVGEDELAALQELIDRKRRERTDG
ncbi:MAG: BlaI/MecI/CopY family transcriptional regulator [Planctomycetota bacterium]|jgi:predicted transcriptional regulator